MKPWVIVNFKTYKESTGKNAQKLAKALDMKSKKVMIAVQASDLLRVKGNVLVQHVDPFTQGRNTGYILPEAIKESGAIGTLINHSEHRVPLKTIRETIARCRKLKLKTVVCAANLQNAKQILRLKPDFIAFEDPKLISTGKSISKVKPEQVKKFAELLKGKKTIPLCGAGVSTKEDVKKALELGTKGVLVASAIVKSKNPKSLLKSFLGVQ